MRYMTHDWVRLCPLENNACQMILPDMHLNYTKTITFNKPDSLSIIMLSDHVDVSVPLGL